MELCLKKVSVLMTVYNAEKYLSQAIESILNQTYADFELIIIDDGSDDGSLSIIERFARRDGRIRYRSRENQGRVISLNEAIDMAIGDYIAIMDADDISKPQRLARQVRYLTEHRTVYLLGTGFDVMVEGDIAEECLEAKLKYERSGNLPIDQSDVFSSINDSLNVLQSTWMVRRELFQVVGKYHDYICEDGEFLFRTACAGLGIDKLPEKLFCYRVYGSTRSSGTERKIKDDQIKFKLNFLIKAVDFGSMETFTYMIWGSDYSGQKAQEELSLKLTNGHFRAYIDSYKDGVSEDGKRVIKPEQIQDFGVDYIFICTNGGGAYARKYLTNMGLTQMKDFFKIV